MRKLVLSTHVTLDGFASGPDGELDWHFSHWNDEMEEAVAEQLSTVDTILVGRVTYEAMADYWPAAAANPEGRRKDIQFAEWMNRVAKIVFSSKLSPFNVESMHWNNTRLIKGDIVENIEALKKERGRDMIIWGGVSIIQTFIKLGIVDEYNIWIAPVILGEGKPLFSDPAALELELIRTKTFRSGVTLVCYRPGKHEQINNSKTFAPGNNHCSYATNRIK